MSNTFETIKNQIIDERIIEIKQLIKKIIEFEGNNNILNDLTKKCKKRIKKSYKQFIKRKRKEQINKRRMDSRKEKRTIRKVKRILFRSSE